MGDTYLSFHDRQGSSHAVFGEWIRVPFGRALSSLGSRVAGLLSRRRCWPRSRNQRRDCGRGLQKGSPELLKLEKCCGEWSEASACELKRGRGEGVCRFPAVSLD